MKRMLSWMIFGCVFALAGCGGLPTKGAVHHVAVIWLNTHGDEDLRQRYVNAIQPLAQLPGVVEYAVGTQLSVPRSRPNAAVDSSFDLVVHSRFSDLAAYQAFLANPDYLRIAQTTLKPMVERYQVYEFVE